MNLELAGARRGRALRIVQRPLSAAKSRGAMSFTRVVAIIGVMLAGLLPARPAGAQVLQAINLFSQRCASCHVDADAGQNAAPPAGADVSRAPTREALSRLRPEAILDALTTGAMAANAIGMTDVQKRILAEYIA